LRRHILALGLALFLFLSLTLTATAAPTDNPHHRILTGTCEGQDVTIVITSGLSAHIVGSNSVLIPLVFTTVGTLTPVGGPPIDVDETYSDGKKVGLLNALVTCEFPVEYTRSDGAEFVGKFVVQALITPRAR
jgi:hypothetical protein